MSDGLLRFLSKGLPVAARVNKSDDGIFVVVSCKGVEIGRRRLNKGACCHSNSPCIGPIAIPEEHQERFGVPAFIHVSFCYDEIQASWDAVSEDQKSDGENDDQS